MYSYGPPHMAGQKQDDQLEHAFSSYVEIRDVVLKTYRRRWTIGRSGERGSGISVLAAPLDDDDDYVWWESRTNEHATKFNSVTSALQVRIGPLRHGIKIFVARKVKVQLIRIQVIRWFKKLCSGCKNLDNHASSCRPKMVDF